MQGRKNAVQAHLHRVFRRIPGENTSANPYFRDMEHKIQLVSGYWMRPMGEHPFSLKEIS